MSHYFSSALALALRLAERAFSSLGKHIPRANQLVCSKATADIVRDNYDVALGALEVFGGGGLRPWREENEKETAAAWDAAQIFASRPHFVFSESFNVALTQALQKPHFDTHTLSTNTGEASTAAQLQRPDAERQKVSRRLRHFECNVKYV